MLSLFIILLYLKIQLIKHLMIEELKDLTNKKKIIKEICIVYVVYTIMSGNFQKQYFEKSHYISN